MRHTAPLLALSLLLGGCGGPDNPVPPAGDLAIQTPFTELIERHLQPISSEDYGFDASESLFRHFERIGEIPFSDSVLIGSISRLGVLDDGRFVIVDRRSEEVHMLHASGQHMQMLDGRACDPGMNWRPFDATPLASGGLLITNASTPKLIRFQPDGSCADIMQMKEWWRGSVVGSDQNHVYTYDLEPNGYTFALRTLDGTVVRQFGASSLFSNYLNRLMNSDLLVARPDGALIVGLPTHAAPVVFDSAGAAARPLFDAPAYVRPFTTDLPSGTGGGPQSIMDAMRKVSEDKTQIHGVYRLSVHTTMVRYRNNYVEISDPEAYGLHVVHDDGRILTPEPVFYSRGHAPHYRGFSPLAVKDNLLFTLRPAAEQPDGDWSNPGLVVWRFRADAAGSSQ